MSAEKKNFVLTEKRPELSEKIEVAINNAIGILKRDIVKYESGKDYPCRYHDGKYEVMENADVRGDYWTEGFWPGQLWLAYEICGYEVFRTVGEKNIEDFYKRVVENNNIDWHHDLGFLYTLSSVAPYKLLKSELGKKSALIAAYSLSRRFRYKGEFIQSMGGEFEEQFYRFIVDTMLNLPLLFLAAEESGENIYREKAIKHLKTTLKYIVRENGSTYHHFLMNNQTGEPISGLTLQGAGDDSYWSRGQAWIIYGLALAYRYTKDESLLEVFEKVTEFFIYHLPEDYIAYWDLVYTCGDEPRDSSATAIAVCGILEMARLVPKNTGKIQYYIDIAVKMLDSLISEKYANSPESGNEGLLLHTTASKPHGFYDSCTVYGDYFYLEALVRAKKDWVCYW